MYRIGFIDYFLDEWHAENYPLWIKQFSKGRFVLHGAYGDIEPPFSGRRSNAEFCRDHDIIHFTSIQDLVDACDALILLAPDNPEEHVRLARETILSDKPIFVDKTFADSEAEGKQIFEMAETYGAPLYSTSALRYASAYERWPDMSEGADILSFGGGDPRQYIIHQLEPLIAQTGKRPERVLNYLGTEVPGMEVQDVEKQSDHHVFLLEFTNNIRATLIQRSDLPFQISVHTGSESQLMNADDAFFERQVEVMLDFFEASIKAKEHKTSPPSPPVAKDETLEIMGTRDLLLQSRKQPGRWTSADSLS